MLWGVYFDECNRSKISEPIRSGSQTIGPVEPSDDTPSVSHSLDSSLREGAGNGGFHSSNRPENPTLRAIFIAPTKTQGILHFTIHRRTLPQSRFARQLPQRGSREWLCHSSDCAKIPRFGPGEGYRVGQGTHVWVPAQSVTKNYQESILWKISM